MVSEIIIPKIGANIEEAEISKIYVREGQEVKRGDKLFEMVTVKASFDIEAEKDGIILKINCKEGEEYKVLDVIGYIGQVGERTPEKKIIEETIIIKATPAARKLAKDYGIEIEKEFKNFEGIVNNEEIEKILNNRGNKFKEEKISPVKKEEIRRLMWNKEALLSSVSIELDYSKISSKIKEYSMNNIKVTTQSLIIKEVSELLKKYPLLNAYYHSGAIRKYNEIIIGVAMDLDGNLRMLNLKENLNNAGEINKQISERVIQIMKKEFNSEDISESTFSVTDLSNYGISNLEPMLNENQSGILGIAKSNYDEKKENIILVLRFDHRVINGKYASEFLRELKNKL